MVKSAKVKLFDQRLNEVLATDIEQSPSRIRRWFTSNFIQRGLSYMFAWTDDNKLVRLRATSGGVLKTIPIAVAAFTNYLSYNGMTRTGAVWLSSNLPDTYYKTDIVVKDAAAIMGFYKESGAWGHDINYPIGEHEIEITHSGFRFKPQNAALTTKIDILMLR
jgi:hypothetical protein